MFMITGREHIWCSSAVVTQAILLVLALATPTRCNARGEMSQNWKHPLLLSVDFCSIFKQGVCPPSGQVFDGSRPLACTEIRLRIRSVLRIMTVLRV